MYQFKTFLIIIIMKIYFEGLVLGLGLLSVSPIILLNNIKYTKKESNELGNFCWAILK